LLAVLIGSEVERVVPNAFMPKLPMNAPAKEMLAATKEKLIKELGSGDHWEGRLSSSALATAVAVFALAQVDKAAHESLINRGLGWLTDNINPDGGWGDSPQSKSNISTTLLCWSALSLSQENSALYKDAEKKAGAWLNSRLGNTDPETVTNAILSHYKEDRTFAVPILTMCALAGRLGTTSAAWESIPQLPFEYAVLPHSLFKWLRLTVVSYALPALIAIGLVRHRHCPTNTPVLRLLRNLVESLVLRKLEHIQPANGGFLEAAPLTGFVVMSLAASGHRTCLATSRSVGFLSSSVRDDGSWPIDTNLSTWVTSLAVSALSVTGPLETYIGASAVQKTRDWLLKQQSRITHAYTHAQPGGWAWTDLPGGVPDADDTSGALLALRRLGPIDEKTRASAMAGVEWLLDLQNKDGGFPAFCRGWGKLPFDRSCPDITAHALRALDEWYDDVVPSLRSRTDAAMQNGMNFLGETQGEDGSWLPLWFGNEHTHRAA